VLGENAVAGAVELHGEEYLLVETLLATSLSPSFAVLPA
jgi:hypothetical protein